MTTVRALKAGEREEMAAFLAYCRAEPLPTKPEDWLAREAEARRRWPNIGELFDGWGVDVAATAREGDEPLMMWRGVKLTRRPMSHVATCWASADEAWKVTRYDEGGPFHARLLLGVYRVEGKADNAVDALDAARAAAQKLRRELSKAIPRRV